MPDSAETLAFIKDTFRSIWSLELMLLLRSEPGRNWPHSELVGRLRGSDSVVLQGVEWLAAAGLVLVDPDGSARYAPASRDLERSVEKAAALYGRKPDAVRRMIVMNSNGQLAAFADAFRLRKD